MTAKHDCALLSSVKSSTVNLHACDASREVASITNSRSHSYIELSSKLDPANISPRHETATKIQSRHTFPLRVGCCYVVPSSRTKFVRHYSCSKATVPSYEANEQLIGSSCPQMNTPSIGLVVKDRSTTFGKHPSDQRYGCLCVQFTVIGELNI